MPSFFPLQPAFNAGELSGRVRGRMDSPEYKVGLSFCENFIPLPQGPLLMRAGSDHILALAGDNRTRLAAMRMANGQDYLVELFDHVMRLYAIDGTQATAVAATVTNLVQNGDFTSTAGQGWTRNPLGEVYYEADAIMPQSTAGAVRLSNVAGGPVQAGRIWQKVTIPAGVISARFSMDVVDITGGTNIIVKLGATDPTADGSAATSEVMNLFGAPAAGVPHITQDFGAIAAGDLYLLLSVDAGGSALDNIKFEVTADVGGFNIVTPWSADEVKSVRYVSETGRDRTIFVHNAHNPWFLKFNSGTAWDFASITFAAKPAEWTGTNWPAVVEVHDGRVFYAGEPNAKNRIVASKSGEPDDLNIGTANPGDAVDMKVSTKGGLRWMKSMRALLAGSDLGEHSVSGSQGVILNGDVHARTESAYGSANVQAVEAGSFILYVTKDRRRVCAVKYDLRSEGWESYDIMFAAEHLTRGDLIKELHYVQSPDPLVIAILDSGKLLFCAFDPDKKVTAFARETLASGLVRSGAVSSGEQGAYFWMAVERAGAMYLERLTLTDLDSNDFLDAAVTVEGFGEGGGHAYNHLQPGDTVGILMNGELYPDQVAGAFGTLFAPAAGDMTVGYRFRASARTLPPEGGNPAGSSLGFKMHNTNFVARVNNSAAPLVNGTRLLPDPGSTTPADAPELLRTGDLFADNLDVDDGSVLIEQDLPFRTEICAIGGKRQLNKV